MTDSRRSPTGISKEKFKQAGYQLAAAITGFMDTIAASVNPNVGTNILSPVATAIEKQTIIKAGRLIDPHSSTHQLV